MARASARISISEWMKQKKWALIWEAQASDFRSNLQITPRAMPSASSITTSAGGDGLSTDVVPRSVIDYANAHLYINPESPKGSDAVA